MSKTALGLQTLGDYFQTNVEDGLNPSQLGLFRPI